MELKFIPCAWQSEAELKCQSLEQRKGYCTGQARRTSYLYSWLKFRDGFQTMVKYSIGRGSQDTHMISSWTFFWLVGDEVTDDVLGISAFWFQAVWGLCACSQHVVTIYHLGGGLSFHRTTQRYASDCYLHSSRKKRVTEIGDSIVLILNWLKLLFGTWGRPWRLKSFFFYCEIIHMLWQNKKNLNTKNLFPLASSLSSIMHYVYKLCIDLTSPIGRNTCLTIKSNETTP